MSNSIQAPEEDTMTLNENPNNYNNSDQWVTIARSCLSTFPVGKTVTMSDFEAWLNSNHVSLPEHVKSMPPSEIYQKIMSIQNCTGLFDQEKEANQIDLPQARFQRTDQWIPVYAWLESLDKDEAVKSKEISDWLSENPAIREQLCSRHSRYHLMHYIKKCHLKILKRRERRKGILYSDKTSPLKVQKNAVTKPSVSVSFKSLSDVPKDDDLYVAKRNEALQKYKILVELESQLSTLFAERKNVNSLTES